MTWKHHIRAKIEQIRIKRSEMYWLTSRNSKLNMGNKLLIYKTIDKQFGLMESSYVVWQPKVI